MISRKDASAPPIRLDSPEVMARNPALMAAVDQMKARLSVVNQQLSQLQPLLQERERLLQGISAIDQLCRQPSDDVEQSEMPLWKCAAQILDHSPEPMTAAQIANALPTLGRKLDAQYPVEVIRSSMLRRPDVFETVVRGTFRLRKTTVTEGELPERSAIPTREMGSDLRLFLDRMKTNKKCYQPWLIKKLMDSGGQIRFDDLGDLFRGEYPEADLDEIKQALRTVIRNVLEKHQIARFQDDNRVRLTARYSSAQVPEIYRILEERIRLAEVPQLRSVPGGLPGLGKQR